MAVHWKNSHFILFGILVAMMATVFEASPSLPESDQDPADEELVVEGGAEMQWAREDVFELIHPQQGELLRESVEQTLYGSSESLAQRRRALETAGYEVAAIERIGSNIKGRVDDLKRQESLSGSEERELTSLSPFVYGAEGQTHIEMTIGICAVMARQLRKLVEVGALQDTANLSEVMSQPDKPIVAAEVDALLNRVRQDPEALGEWLESAQQQLSTPVAKKQFTAANKVLRRVVGKALQKK